MEVRDKRLTGIMAPPESAGVHLRAAPCAWPGASASEFIFRTENCHFWSFPGASA